MKQLLKMLHAALLRSPLHYSIGQRKPFPTYHFLLLAAGVALLMSSCQKELPDIFPKPHHHQKTVPFKAEFTVTPEVVQNPAPGTPLIHHLSGTGTGSPIGKATYDSYVTIDVFGPHPNVGTANATITAANGDQILMKQTGIISGPDANGETRVALTGTITGGTGRFADATGTVTGLLTAKDKSPTETISLEGTITYLIKRA